MLNHLAIIMDGNGRWAQVRGRPRNFGHVKGTRVAKKIITKCADLGIKHLTLYAFSTENWLRPPSEVSLLMKLLRKYLARETKNLVKKNIRFTTIGQIEKLPRDVVESIKAAKLATAQCTGLNLIFAISYGSRAEITDAVKKIAQEIEAGTLKASDVDESAIHSRLSTYPAHDPDLIIRTSGEKRLSNFLMWQSSYSEFYFCDTLWPDFTAKDLDLALSNYNRRERRYGALLTNDESLN